MIKNNGNILYVINFSISYEQRFLFCMAFAWRLRSHSRGLSNKPATQQTSHANDFVLTLKAMQ